MDIDLMQNPYNGQALHRVQTAGRPGLSDENQAFFPIRNGYPDFLAGRSLTGLNRRFQRVYDRVGRAGWIESAFNLLFGLDERRKTWLEGLEINPGDRVLEVSVGTGSNIRHLPAHARYFGIDISRGMLDRCVKNAARWDREIALCQADAEHLPYRDNVFDSVFHLGGINFFNDRGRAISEMIRVARPGAPIVIIDETEKELQAQVRKWPFVRRYFREADVDRSRLYAPAQFVPEEIRDVEVRLIDNGSMYRLSFIKPLPKHQVLYRLPNT